MNGPLAISLIPRKGEPRYGIYRCTRGNRVEVEVCASIEEALRRVREIRGWAEAEHRLLTLWEND